MTSTPEPSRKGGGSWFQRTVALLGALAAATTVVVAVQAQMPERKPLEQRLATHLKQLHAANVNLSAALNSIGGSTKLSRLRSDTALRRTDKIAAVVRTAELDGDHDRQVKASVDAVVTAERAYLKTVRAFLLRKPGRAQKKRFWSVSEVLRERLDELSAYAGVVGADAIDGAHVLSAWYRSHGGDDTALKRFPKAKRKQARKQVQVNVDNPPAPDPTRVPENPTPEPTSTPEEPEPTPTTDPEPPEVTPTTPPVETPEVTPEVTAEATPTRESPLID